MPRVFLMAGALLALAAAGAEAGSSLSAPPRPAGRARSELQIRAQNLWLNINGARAEIAALRDRLVQEPVSVAHEQQKENPRAIQLREDLAGLKARRTQLRGVYLEESVRIQQL